MQPRIELDKDQLNRMIASNKYAGHHITAMEWLELGPPRMPYKLITSCVLAGVALCYFGGAL